MKRGLIVVGCLLLISLLPQIYHSDAQTTSFQPHTLINATPEELGEYAINLTQLTYHVRSGTPRVRLVRSVTTTDLAELGFGWSGFGGQEPPLALVVLQGDFEGNDFGSIGGGKILRQFQFISYVFDLQRGAPTRISISPKGEQLRKVLNDPSLPDTPIHTIPRPGTPNPPHNVLPAVPYPAPSSNVNTPAPQPYPAPSASQSTAPVEAPYPTP